MPKYRYRCPNCEEFVAYEALESCPACGAPVQRLMPRVFTVYKAFGFYSTDRVLGPSIPKPSKRTREKMLEPEKGYKSG